MADERENLAWRAATLLKDEAGHRGGVRIELEKRIPVGGGLGGGSADAAAVLRGLNEMWRLGLSTEQLSGLGAKLGSDVPGLVHGGAVRLEGRGDRVTTVIPAPGTHDIRWWLVLLNPGFSISTRDIYERYRPHLTSNIAGLSIAVRAWEEGRIDLAAEGLFNALQETVFGKYPLLRLLAAQLAEAGGKGVLLSGSGATVFALTGGRSEAEHIAGSIRRSTGCTPWCEVVSIERTPAAVAAAGT